MPNTIVREKIRKKIVQTEMREELARAIKPHGQVTVHIIFPAQMDGYYLRIWKSTFLYSRSSDHKSSLLHVENISIAPYWTEVKPHQTHTFTLIFEGFPADVLVFDLTEEIPEPGGFHYANIVRNEQDVYWIRG